MIYDLDLSAFDLDTRSPFTGLVFSTKRPQKIETAENENFAYKIDLARWALPSKINKI